MTISLFDAITSIREDENWIKKVAIGGGIFCAVLVLSFIIGFIFGFLGLPSRLSEIIGFVLGAIVGIYLTGFIFITGHKQLNSDSKELACWKESGLFMTGLKTLGAYIVYSLIFTIVLLIISFAVSIILIIFTGLICLIPFVNNTAMLPSITTIVTLVLGIVTGLFLALFINTAFACYIKNLNFSDAFAFKKHFAIVKENYHACWTLVGKMVLYSLLFLLCSFVFMITIIGNLLMPFLYFAAYLVYINLLVQFGKEIKIEKYL